MSTAIKQLELQFDVRLFTRNTREVSLTDTGREWLPRVREALHGVDLAIDDLVTRSRTLDGTLRIGYLIGTGADLLFKVVRHFEAAHPDVTVETTEYDFADPTAGLADGTSEVALIRPPVDLDEHRMLILDSENWVACLPRDHRLAGADEVDIEQLLDDPIVCAPMSAGTWRDYWLGMDARAGREPTIAAIAATYETETTMISRGLGISFTTSACARLYERPGIVYVPIANRPPSYTALAWNPRHLSREAEAMVSHVQAEWNFGEVLDL